MSTHNNYEFTVDEDGNLEIEDTCSKDWFTIPKEYVPSLIEFIHYNFIPRSIFSNNDDDTKVKLFNEGMEHIRKKTPLDLLELLE